MALPPPPEEGTVAVVVRVRPLAPCEQRQAGHRILHVVDQHILTFDPEEQSGPPSSTLPTRRSKQQGKDLKFVFDRVLGEGATQEEVFQHTTCEMLDSILNGYNCSVFAYGATGAGKTYTMLGSEKNPGIMYRTMVELYRRIEAREEKSFKVLVSYQEVYNEQIHDLLEPKHPLAIREDPEKGVVVQGLSFHQPTSAEQLLEMLANGNKNRTQHPTNANATSSRSHAVFQIYLQQQDCIGSLTRDLQVAKMSLIDLAGSERASVTKAKGERLREGANINRSLLALINVMNALADSKSKKTHIPYRDSKLTRLLKDSIGGNCRTVMIAAVSPSILAYEDTYNTLQYASRAKEIKLSLKSNVLSFVCPVNKYAVICEQLKAEVADLQAKLRAYKDAAWEAENRAPALLGPISSSTVGLLRLEEAVPKTCLAPDFQRESDGDQQELESGWPVQLQPELEKELLQTLEEMPPSSPRATHQTDIQLEQKKPSCLLQGLSSSQPETLLAAILNVAKKQYSLLKDADLLTPDLVSEFEELEHLVNQVVGVNLEQAMSPNRPTELSGAAPAQRMQQGCDAEASVAVSSTPVSSTTLQCLQQLALLSSSMQMALSPVKKRRKSERKSGTPRSLKTQMKCKEMCGKKVETPRAMQSLGTSCLKAAAQTSPVSTLPLCSTPKICTLTVTKGHAPLVVSPAQNCCTQPALPVHDLNVTYEICKDSNSPGMAKPVAFSMPEFPVCDNIQSILNKQDRPSVPKPHVPLFAMRSSSIPKPTVSKASARKRRQMDSTTYPSLGRLQSHMTQLLSSSQGSVKPSCIPDDLCALRMQPEHPLGAFAWKGSKRTTKRLAAHGGAPPAPTSQPMKL